MRDIAAQLLEWADEGDDFVVATIVGVRGSAPRGPGAAMAVRADGSVLGSLSGGCIEGAVYELAHEVLRSGVPIVEEFDYDPDDPFAVGLTCGGTLRVSLRRVRPGRDGAVLAALRAALAGEPVGLAHVLDGPPGTAGITRAVVRGSGERAPEPPAGSAGTGTTGDPSVDELLDAEMLAALDQGSTALRDLCLGDRGPNTVDVRVFVESWVPPPRMLIFGAVDFAAAVAGIGRFLGYRVTVCDARAVFATAERFPDAHEVVVDWPHRYLAATETDRRTVVCVLTHDTKFDVPVLTDALRRPLAYIGAMGSRRTHEERLRRLREAGLRPDELARLHSPTGLDLGARTPEETALSIAAEITAARHGGTGAPLSYTRGPIHHRDPATAPATSVG